MFYFAIHSKKLFWYFEIWYVNTYVNQSIYFSKYVRPIFGYRYKGKFSIKPTHPFLRKKWSKKLLLFVLGISKALLIMKAVPPTMNNASLWCHFFVHFLVYNNTMSFNAFLDNMDTTGEYSTKIQDVMKNNHKTILCPPLFLFFKYTKN